MAKDKREPREREDKKEDEVVLIEDLTPREDVTGGRKILLGEIAPDASESRS